MIRRAFIRALSGAAALLPFVPREAEAAPVQEPPPVDFEPVRPQMYRWEVRDEHWNLVSEGISSFGDMPPDLPMEPGRMYTYRTRGCGL